MLKNADESFRLLFAANPHPMWVFDNETLAFLEVNKAAEKQYGYSRQEFLSMQITEIRPPQDVERLVEEVRADSVTESSFGVWRHRRKDGGLIDVEIASHPLPFNDRAARLVIAQDISERKAAREALAAQARQFALVADLALQALSGAEHGDLFQSAVEQVAAELNVALCKVLELMPDGETLRLRAAVGLSEPFRLGQPLLKAGAGSLAGFILQSNEAITFDDLRAESRFRAAPILTEHGVVSGVGAVIPGSERPFGVLTAFSTHPRHFEAHDIVFMQTVANILATAVERARADEAVRASEARFRAVVQNAQHMVTIVDGNGKIIYDSPPVHHLLGYDLQERLGQSVFDYIHPDDAATALATLSELSVAENPHTNLQMRVRHGDGSWRHVEANTVNMLDAAPLQGIVVNWYDVTERVRIQREIEELNAELEARVAQRTAQLEATNRELEAFAYSVSHDLRAPLRAIDGFARILTEEAAEELSPGSQRYLQRIRHNAQQMDRLIQELLGFARLNRQTLKKQPVAPDEVAREALQGFAEEQQERNVQVTVRALPPACADRSMLLIVFTNLLSNAFKFTRVRQAAKIEVGALGAAEREDGHNVYYVRDNGVGFNIQYASRVFGVFQRLHRVEEYEGTGVGLATVQRIIRRHGGEVWFESGEEQGATLYFTLEGTKENG